MKTVRIGIVVLGLFLNGGASAEQQRGSTVWDGFSGFLQPDWERDFSLTLGVKVWVNEWTRDTFFFENTQVPDLLNGIVIGGLDLSGTIFTNRTDQSPTVQTSDIEPTPIPQLSVRYKWLLLSGSYYPETDFEFRTAQTNFTVTQTLANFTDVRTDQFTFLRTTTAEREEWDAGLGILIHPNVAILGGYKQIDQEIGISSTLDILSNVAAPVTAAPGGRSSSEIEIRGPTIGVAGSVPITGGFGLYASYARGFMDVDITDTNIVAGTSTTRDSDAEYDVAELGFSYTHGTKEFIPFALLSAATVYAGYRWQHIETDFSDVPNTEDRTDTTRGFVAGVNLSF